MKHPMDPPAQFDAAKKAGRLIAQGLLEADEFLPDLMDAAVRGGFRGNRSGLQARLSWALLDSAAHWRMVRSKAEFEINKALVPLLEARAPSVSIFELAESVNESLGQPLLSHEVVAIAEDRMAFAMSGTRKYARRRV